MDSSIIKRLTASSPPTGLSWEAIIGIAAAGGIVLLGLVTVILVVLIRRHHRRKLKNSRRRSFEEFFQYPRNVSREYCNNAHPPASAHMRQGRYSCYSANAGYAMHSDEGLPMVRSSAPHHEGYISGSQDQGPRPPNSPNLLLQKKVARKRANTHSSGRNDAYLSAVIESSPPNKSARKDRDRIPDGKHSSSVSQMDQNFAQYTLLQPASQLDSSESRQCDTKALPDTKLRFASGEDNVYDESIPFKNQGLAIPSLVDTGSEVTNLAELEFAHNDERCSGRSSSIGSSHMNIGPSPAAPIPPLPNHNFNGLQCEQELESSPRSSCSSDYSADSSGSSILRLPISPNMQAAAEFSQRHPEMKLGYQIRKCQTDLKNTLVDDATQRRPGPQSRSRARSHSRATSPSKALLNIKLDIDDQTLKSSDSLESLSNPKSRPMQKSKTASARIIDERAKFRFPNLERDELRPCSPGQDKTIAGRNPFNWSTQNNMTGPVKRSALKGSPNARNRLQKGKNSVTISLEATVLGPKQKGSSLRTSIPMEPQIQPPFDASLRLQTDNTKDTDMLRRSLGITTLVPGTEHRLLPSPPRTSAIFFTLEPDTYSPSEDGHARQVNKSDTSSLRDQPTAQETSLGSGITSYLSASTDTSRISRSGTAFQCRSDTYEQVAESSENLNYNEISTPGMSDIESSQDGWVRRADQLDAEHPAPLNVKHRFDASTLPVLPVTAPLSAIELHETVSLTQKHLQREEKVSGFKRTHKDNEEYGDRTVRRSYLLKNRPLPEPPTDDGESEYEHQAFQPTQPRGPRAPPGLPLKSQVKALRRMDSSARGEDHSTESGGMRRYMSMGREASPNMSGGSPDLKDTNFLQDMNLGIWWEKERASNSLNNECKEVKPVNVAVERLKNDVFENMKPFRHDISLTTAGAKDTNVLQSPSTSKKRS